MINFEYARASDIPELSDRSQPIRTRSLSQAARTLSI